MDSSEVRAFIQARMSSARFPGKVLAPLKGQPIIGHVISQVARVLPPDRITVATSIEQSDDPLAYYVHALGISVHRGSLDNVFERFQSCLQAYPCAWFFRICADSPLLSSAVFGQVLAHIGTPDVDLVTNVQVRTFPKGQSVEMIKSATFAGIDSTRLSEEEREHPTKVYYDHPTDFKIMNIESGDPGLAQVNVAVDTLEDLHRIEKTPQSSEARPERDAGASSKSR